MSFFLFWLAWISAPCRWCQNRTFSNHFFTRFSLYHLEVLLRITMDICCTLILSACKNQKCPCDLDRKKINGFDSQGSTLSTQPSLQQSYRSPPCTWSHCRFPIQCIALYHGWASQHYSALVWGLEANLEIWSDNDLCKTDNTSQGTKKSSQTQNGSESTYGLQRLSRSNLQSHQTFLIFILFEPQRWLNHQPMNLQRLSIQKQMFFFRKCI